MADTDNKDEVKNWHIWAFLLLGLAISAITAMIFILLSDYVLLAILFLPMLAVVVLGALNVKM